MLKAYTSLRATTPSTSMSYWQRKILGAPFDHDSSVM
jgi:hypothetical protein